MTSAYTLSLLSLDSFEDIPSVKTNSTKIDNFITLNVDAGLSPRRLWNSTVLAYGCQDHPVLSGVELSESINCYNGFWLKQNIVMICVFFFFLFMDCYYYTIIA